MRTKIQDNLLDQNEPCLDVFQPSLLSLLKNMFTSVRRKTTDSDGILVVTEALSTNHCTFS